MRERPRQGLARCLHDRDVSSVEKEARSTQIHNETVIQQSVQVPIEGEPHHMRPYVLGHAHPDTSCEGCRRLYGLDRRGLQRKCAESKVSALWERRVQRVEQRTLCQCILCLHLLSVARRIEVDVILLCCADMFPLFLIVVQMEAVQSLVR